MKSFVYFAMSYLLAGVFGLFISKAEAEVVVYAPPAGVLHNDDFSVKVRAPGGDWQDLFEYAVQVDLHNPQNSSMAYFDFTGRVEISVTNNRGPIKSTRIRPLSYGVLPEVKGNTLTFILSEPRNLSVEIDGDIFHNLQIFAGPIETNRPNKDDPNVVYFGSGVHELPRRGLQITSGKTVFIDGGAVVQGHLLCNKVENVRIVGRGILSKAPGGGRIGGIKIDNSKNVLIDGIIITPPGGSINISESNDIRVANIKSISYGQWSDGIDVYCSRNVVIEGVFMRNSDDCIAIYAHRNKWYGDVKNVTVKNSTLWADVAHPILVGTHGNTENPETIEDLQFINLDILEHHEMQIDYQGCMSLNAGDSNLIRNVRFENIRIEDFQEGQLVNLRVMFNKKYNTSPGIGIENVLFKDITYNGTHANLSVIAGYDDTRKIKNVVFENLKINGQIISDKMPGKPEHFKTGDMARFLEGEHVEGLAYRAASDETAAKTRLQGVQLAKPTPLQLAFQDMELGVFIHYSIDTYGSRSGASPASAFNPTALNAEQWVLAAKAMGAKYVVLTARHEQGFCLWPTATTDYSVKSSPYKDGRGDIVREFVDACKKHGMKAGLYNSPWIDDHWDANQPGFARRGSNAEIDKYDDPAIYEKVLKKESEQLRELMTNYGPLVFFWCDHFGRSDSLDATPHGGKLRELYATLSKLAHELQPECLYFGPDVEHVGNEAGRTAYPLWNAVTTLDGTNYSISTTFKWEGNNTGDPLGKFFRPRLGSTTDALSTGGWMWTGPRRIQSLERRMQLYYEMIGRGAGVIVNLVPDRSGLIPENLVAAAKEMGDEINRRLSKPVGETKGTGDLVTLQLSEPRQIDHIVTMEDLTDGQKIAEYEIQARLDGEWKTVAQGSTIGHKKIDRIEPITTDAVRFRCVKSIGTPVKLRSFAVFDAR
jgi:alpha-L-fucosidase